MSGEKRTPVQILRDDLRSMRKQVQNVQKQRQQLQDELARARRQHNAQLSQVQNQMRQRDAEYQSTFNSLQTDIRKTAEQHHRAIQAQRKEFQKAQKQQRAELLKEMDKLETRTDEKISILKSWTEGSLNKQRKEYLRITKQQQAQINNIKSDIRRINQREDNRHNRAAAYISDLQKLIENVDKNLPHQKFAPNQLNKIIRQLELAKQNLNNDIPSAAISNAQQAHFDLMDLEEEVTRKEMEFEMIHGAALEAVTALFETVRKNRNIELEGDSQTHEADFWTNGKFSELETKIAAIKSNLENNKESLSVEEVNQDLDELEKLSLEQEALLKEGVERIISAQLRAEMGDIVVSSLEEQGYRILSEEDTGYAGQDQRKPYLIKMESASGTTVVTVIAPDENTHQNIISVNTYNSNFANEHAIDQQNHEILEALKEGGLQMGKTECMEEGVAEFYDVKNILKHNEKIPKNVLQKAGILNSQTTDKE